MGDYAVYGILVDSAEHAAKVILGEWLYAGGRNSQDYVSNLDAKACVDEFIAENGTWLGVCRVGTNEYEDLGLDISQLEAIAQGIIDEAAQILIEADREDRRE